MTLYEGHWWIRKGDARLRFALLFTLEDGGLDFLSNHFSSSIEALILLTVHDSVSKRKTVKPPIKTLPFNSMAEPDNPAIALPTEPKKEPKTHQSANAKITSMTKGKQFATRVKSEEDCAFH